VSAAVVQGAGQAAFPIWSHGWARRVVPVSDTRAPARGGAARAGSYNSLFVMKNGDRERFEAFVRTSRRAMLRIAQNLCRTSGVDPEDLVAEALERAFRQMERGAGWDPLALPFVARVMANLHVDKVRRLLRRAEKTSEQAAPEGETEKEAVVDPEPLERWRSVPDAELREAVDALRPERIREVFRLHSSGMRYKEIALRLGIPEGTVGSDLSIARRQLRRQLLGRAS